MDPVRRRLLAALVGAPIVGACATTSTVQTAGPPPEGAPHDMDLLLQIPGATGHQETIALVLYPGFTLLDLVGPHHVLVNLLGATVLLVGEGEAPVVSDTGVALIPTTSFASCPRALTAVLVPGGTDGTLAAMESRAMLDFLVSRESQWLTSVCTGSLVLGAAGLLRGYRATSHWVVRDVLEELGATPVDERVVQDRNRLSGAGVTAGIDLALTLAMSLRGRAYAEVVQLFAEYAPAPPLAAGTPHTAPPSATAALEQMLRGFTTGARDAARRARARWS